MAEVRVQLIHDTLEFRNYFRLSNQFFAAIECDIIFFCELLEYIEGGNDQRRNKFLAFTKKANKLITKGSQNSNERYTMVIAKASTTE